MVKRKTSSEKGFRRRFIMKKPTARYSGRFVFGRVVGIKGLKRSSERLARDFCFKYGEKQDGRDDLDGFRRPLHIVATGFPCVYFMGKAARNLIVGWHRPLINKGIMQLETV